MEISIYVRIIRRLWSHIIDLKMYINGTGSKSYEEIKNELIKKENIRNDIWRLKSMSKKYVEKQLTGMEYVDAARELCGYTINRCLQLPAEWGHYLLDPLVDDANEIERLVYIANRVYINSKNQPEEDLIKAYQTSIMRARAWRQKQNNKGRRADARLMFTVSPRRQQ